jgi:hypothetical protein
LSASAFPLRKREREIAAALLRHVVVEGLGERIRQFRHLRAFKRGGDARDELAAQGFIVRQGEQIGTGVEVLLPTGQSVAFGELFGEVIAKEFGLKKGWVGLEEFENGFTLLFSLRFERPPGEKRRDDRFRLRRYLATTPEKRQRSRRQRVSSRWRGFGRGLRGVFPLSRRMRASALLFSSPIILTAQRRM